MREMTGLCALGARPTDHLGHIIVGFVKGALGEWIIIVHGTINHIYILDR